MAVFRVVKDDNFTTISNFHLKDRRLTLKAKGLLTMMLSLKEEWNYSIAGLAAISVEKESAIKSGLNELKEYGYLIVNKMNPSETESGRYEYEYIIYEVPQGEGVQYIEKQGIENQPVEIQSVENLAQLNTKESKTDNQNTNQSKTKKNKRFQKPTVEQIAEYATERGYPDFDAEYFWDYWESKGWMRGRDKIRDWKAAFRNWVKRNKKNETSEDIYDNEYANVW